MDAFTIILCFLLKSFGSDPVQIRESDDMKLPRSSAEDGLVDAVVIGISSKSIQVNDVKVADLRNGAGGATPSGSGSVRLAEPWQ